MIKEWLNNQPASLMLAEHVAFYLAISREITKR